MSKVYFASDTHFGHSSIIKWRKKENGMSFQSVQEHDAYVYEKLSAKLGPRDCLYLLGDVAFNMDGFDYVRILSAQCRKVTVIIGNHDFERAGCPTMIDYMNAGIALHAMVKYKGFWLTHAPLHPDELQGCMNIHGHVHSQSIPDERYINVSVEAIDFDAVTLEDIRAMASMRAERLTA